MLKILDVSGLIFSKVYYLDFLESIESSAISITIPKLSCNDRNYTTFDFSRFTFLQSLEIGHFSFGFVQNFTINKLRYLKTLKIAHNSFTETRNSKGNNESKSFHILNCDLLESIDIGEYCFSDFAGDFELKNLPSLQSLKIGKMDFPSNCFYYSSFIIQGIVNSETMLFFFVDLPKLQFITLGDYVFAESLSIVMEGME